VIGFVWAALGSIVTFIVMAALGDMVSQEVRDRLDHLPHAILRLAAKRLDPGHRAVMYEDEWMPELTYILKGDEARPVTRLYHGTCFALGIYASAGKIACQAARPALGQGVRARTVSVAGGFDTRGFLMCRGRTTTMADEVAWRTMVDQLMSEFRESPKRVRPVLLRSQGREIDAAELAQVWKTAPDGELLSQLLVTYLDLTAPQDE